MYVFKHGKMSALCNSQEEVDFLQKRGEFFKKYCEEKGWPTDPEKLSIKQILEVREQEDWKNPK